MDGPPFFLGDLGGPSDGHAVTHRASDLPFESLFENTGVLLDSSNIFSIVIPSRILRIIISRTYVLKFCLVERYNIGAIRHGRPGHCLLSFTGRQCGKVRGAVGAVASSRKGQSR